PLLEKALAIKRKLLGEDHPDTALSCNAVATNLMAQGKYAQAQVMHEQALAIRRKVLGEDHPLTAASYYNLAGTLSSQDTPAPGPSLRRASGRRSGRWRSAARCWARTTPTPHPATTAWRPT